MNALNEIRELEEELEGLRKSIAYEEKRLNDEASELKRLVERTKVIDEERREFNRDESKLRTRNNNLGEELERKQSHCDAIRKDIAYYETIKDEMKKKILDIDNHV